VIRGGNGAVPAAFGRRDLTPARLAEGHADPGRSPAVGALYGV
jgi:hypothetical protein